MRQTAQVIQFPRPTTAPPPDVEKAPESAWIAMAWFTLAFCTGACFGAAIAFNFRP